MDVTVGLQSVGDLELTAAERAIFNVLKATLQYPVDAKAKGAKLADDIDFFSKSAEGGPGLWYVWVVVLDIACCIPPGHSWQDSLLRCLDNLRQREGHPKGYYCPNDEQLNLWKDLPDFSPCVREKWNTDPTEHDEDSSEEFAKWKNLNSFIARFMSNQAAIWLNLPVWQLRAALEEQQGKDSRPATECRLWVASEWIIQCAGPIFKEMNSKAELDEYEARVHRTGSLCGSEPLSIERWEFWRKRFSELVAGVDSTVAAHVSDALQSMDAAEE